MVLGESASSGLLALKVVQPAAGVGVNQGQRALFALQGADEGDQQAMLHDIGAVAGMEGMTVIHREDQKLARPAGLEPAASRLEVSRSIQMSYGRAPETWETAAQ